MKIEYTLHAASWLLILGGVISTHYLGMVFALLSLGIFSSAFIRGFATGKIRL